MKRFDDSTKKLIKNVVALITSALVLVFATVAWLTSGGRANISGSPTNVINTGHNIAYYHLARNGGGNYLLNEATTDTSAGTNALFTFLNIDGTTPASQPDIVPASADWGEVGTGAITWTTDMLFPGEYETFIMDVQQGTNAPVQLVISGISCTAINTGETLTEDQVKTVYDNLYLFAVAEKKADHTVLKKVCGSFSDLMSNGAITALTGLLTPTGYGGSDVTVVIYIGVPGSKVIDSSTTPNTEDNLRNAHEALREIGAKVSFTKVSID